MENRSYYINIERILTISLFLPILFLFPSKILPFKIFLFSGIITGVIGSYFIGDKFQRFIKFVSIFSILAVILWMVYGISKSSFFYKDVIIICIEAVAILVVIFCFIAYSEEYLTYVQLFALILFLCICSLVTTYNKTSVFYIAAFIFCILAIARVKFLILFTSSLKKAQKLSTGDVFFLGLLFLTIFFAWMLLINIPFGKIKVWGAFQEEEIGQTEEQQKLENENGSLSDDSKIQDELTRLTLKLGSTDEMHKGIKLIGYLLVKEAPYASEVAVAEEGLQKTVDNSALEISVDKRDELSASIKTYVSKKIALNFSRIKNSMGKIIENNHIGLWQRVNILGAANRLEYSNSLKEIEKYSEQIKSASSDSVISSNVSEQLNQYGRELKEWKLFQLYRSKFSDFPKRASALTSEGRSELNNIIQQISEIDKISESRSIQQTINRMRDKTSSALGEYLNRAEDSLNLKKEMFLAQDAIGLREKLASFNISPDKLKELEKYLNNIEGSNNIDEITKAMAELIDSLRRESDSRILKEVAGILQTKIDSLIDKLADSMSMEISKGKFKDSGKKLFEELKKMESEFEKGKVNSYSKKVIRLEEEYFKQGEITSSARDDLIRETGELEGLLNIKLELRNQGKADNLLEKTAEFNYEKKFASFLENSSLGDDQKDIINKLTEKLESASTISQVEDALEAINREVGSSTNKLDKEDAKKIKELTKKIAEAREMLIFERNSTNLRKEIEDLKSILPQKAGLLEKNLDKLREIKDSKELSQAMLVFDQLTEYGQEEKESEAGITSDGSKELKGYLIGPSRIVLPVGRLISLKSISVYKNKQIRDLSSGLEWVSSNPNVVFVDQNGSIRTVSKGSAEITVLYRRAVSGKCIVAVVGGISETEQNSIRNELGSKENQ